MNKLNFKSILNTNRTNRNTKNLNTNNNYDLTTTINLQSKKGVSKNKKNLELKTKYDKPENNPYNTISSMVTPNFVGGPVVEPSRFKPGHKKNISEVPVNHIDMLIEKNRYDEGVVKVSNRGNI
jgi:hypothetical protein